MNEIARPERNAQAWLTWRTQKRYSSGKYPSLLAGTVMFERYYTTGQLAKALGVTAPTVRAWVAQELIPAARVGQRGRLRFDLEAVRQAIEAKVKRPAAGRQPAA